MKDKISSTVVLADLKKAISDDIEMLNSMIATDENQQDFLNELFGFKHDILLKLPEISEGTKNIPSSSRPFKSYKAGLDFLETEEFNLQVLRRNVDNDGIPKEVNSILKTILNDYNTFIYRLKNKKMKGNFNAVKS